MNDSYPVIKAGLLPIPGKCFKCGSDQRDCIDLGYDAEYYGAMLLCLACAHSLSDVPELGFVTADSVREMETELARLKRLEAKLGKAKVALNSGILSAIDSFDDILDSDDPLPVVVVETPEKSIPDFYGAFSKGN